MASALAFAFSRVILVNHERADLLIGHGREDPGEIAGLTRLEGAQFYARPLCGRPGFREHELGGCVSRIQQDSHPCH